MASSVWSGYLTFGLISLPVRLFSGARGSHISFHMLHRDDNTRIKQQLWCPHDERVVERSEIVKGYEYRKGQYVIIEPSELANLRVPSKHTIEVSQFIDLPELNPEYVEKPYFVTPETDTQSEAFGVVRQALLKLGKAAIGKVAFSGRENIIAVVPAGGEDGRGMMAYTLRYESELRNQADYFRDIKQPAINADSLELAETLIRKMSAKLNLGKFQDGYEVAVKALVDAKVNNLPIPIDEGPAQRPSNVINLMDALRQSVGKDVRGEKKPPKSEKELPGKKIGVVKAQAKTASKRKSA